MHKAIGWTNNIYILRFNPKSYNNNLKNDDNNDNDDAPKKTELTYPYGGR